jgi:hypothetical protein
VCAGFPRRRCPISHPTRRSCTITVHWKPNQAIRRSIETRSQAATSTKRSTSRLSLLYFLFPMRGGGSTGCQKFLGSNCRSATLSSKVLPCLIHRPTKLKSSNPQIVFARCRDQRTNNLDDASAGTACMSDRADGVNSSSISAHPPTDCPFSPSARALIRLPRHALGPYLWWRQDRWYEMHPIVGSRVHHPPTFVPWGLHDGNARITIVPSSKRTTEVVE